MEEVPERTILRRELFTAPMGYAPCSSADEPSFIVQLTRSNMLPGLGRYTPDVLAIAVLALATRALLFIQLQAQQYVSYVSHTLSNL